MRQFATQQIFTVFVAVLLLSPVVAVAQSASQDFTINTQVGENTEPPTVPDPVTATPIADTQINVEWGASSDPFGVAGYQVFRDGSQVATTSATLFEDTGLQASTTYAYFIRAFDVAGNISSSSVTVATTTFAAPTPPPVVEPPDQPRAQSGRAPDPQLLTYALVPGATSAYLSFSTNVPTRYIIRYGRTGEYELGTIETEVFRAEHSTILSDLQPGSTYQYELLVRDRYQQSEVVRRASFTTEPRFPIQTLPNVRNLQAVPISSDVLLRWEMPDIELLAGVRVVRNHHFFPRDPFDGEVVYQGRAESFTDSGALSERARQYYTVFVMDLSDNFSSGAIAVADRRDAVSDPLPEPLPEIIPPIPTTTDPDLEPLDLRFTDITFIQADQEYIPDADRVELDTRTSFVLRVPVERTPPHLKIITATISRLEGRPGQDTYLLRRDPDGRYYEAEIDRLGLVGEHQVIVSIYDLQNEVQYQLTGTIGASTVSAQLVEEDEPWYLSFGYWFAGFLTLTLLLFWLWRLLLLLLVGSRAVGISRSH